QTLGTFSSREIELSGKVAVAQRVANLQLYNATIETGSLMPTNVTTTEWQFGSVNPLIAFESFENCPANGLPYTWTRFAENVTLGTVSNAWDGTSTERSITGTHSAKMGNYKTVSDCWLVTPKLAITATSANAVSFNWSNTPGDFGSKLDVWVSESATQPVVGTAFTTLVKSIGEGADGAWHLENLDLSAFIGKSIYIGFKVHNFGNPTDVNAGGDNWWIEDVKLPLPNYIGVGNNTRGMAFGTVNSVPTLAIVSREGGNSVRIIDVATGNQTASLDMTGITGGVVVDMNDAGITTDGKILVSNVVNGISVFKVYRWDNYYSAPTVALSYSSPDASRYGDYFTVTGSITAGSAKIYVASSKIVASVAKVLKFSMIADVANPGSYIFDPVPVVVTSAINWAGTMPSIAELPNGKFLYKGNGNSMRTINADGTLATLVSDNGTVATSGNSVQHVRTIGDSTYVAYFRYGAGWEKADILKIVRGDLSSATIVATTTALGTNANANGTGRVLVDASASDIYLYVMSSNNGFGKYKVAGIVDQTTRVEKTIDNTISLITSQGKLSVKGINPSSIELFNIIGQKIISVTNTNEISTANLQGVYIVQVKSEGKIVKTGKIVIK
ncbi:MAG: T9SS type A sorting domain-containing protein, partial [Paludibacter sp.]|nr:T9SS type A sorting domain-containing protein [Paludibacter sp.]